MTDEFPPPGVSLENAPCPLGCNGGDDLVVEGRDRLHGIPGRFTVVRCRGCGLMRTSPRPSQDTIAVYYPENYGPFLGTRVKPPAPVRASSPAWRRAIGRRLASLEDNSLRLPPIPRGRMLEIGCASGSFLHQMAARGWEVRGIEPSAGAAQNARSLGYPVHAGSLESAADPAEPFDLIVGWMVLEHLSNPIEALRRLHRWTRPGGWLALSVPNCGSLEFRVFRHRWFALQLPCHLYHFVPATLRCVLERAGWDPIRILHQRSLSNLLASAGYLLEDRGFSNRASRWLLEYPERQGRAAQILFPVASLLALAGQTGRMTVWARKLA